MSKEIVFIPESYSKDYCFLGFDDFNLLWSSWRLSGIKSSSFLSSSNSLDFEIWLLGKLRSSNDKISPFFFGIYNRTIIKKQ